ncbi:MAG TPA: hypothetical protein VHQ65_16445 [Thermoanaerobaculia bacterium]|nr:hypothetical protein [Thermoanaerobaculia bacterium]
MRVPPPTPPARRLRAFAFDPSLATELEASMVNQVTLELAWEGSDGEGRLLPLPGPVGEYLEVVDVDPPSRSVYAPVDLNQRELLAQDGLPPSEGHPQFHQQMVYAVAMTTIAAFEDALGRKALWAPRRGPDGPEFVRRLRIYPHALREANAYYSPEKKALLFGYFRARRSRTGTVLPGGMVFSCLSHDIVAHETTHALLDGMHHRYLEQSNVDSLAFHEAFADLVALFQHFSFPEALRQQIATTRGDLSQQNRLAELAQQFGYAVGRYGALRDALGTRDEKTKQWHALEPDPASLARASEPHTRGAILVAAVFDAFLAIYKRRIADLLRIASGGSGILPPGDLHPDLVDRLADAAAKTARQFCRMAIRALDYCPPVDVTFGDYFRALVTADADLVPSDPLGYRVAVIESFRRWGIYPEGVRSLSEDSITWWSPPPEQAACLAGALPEIGELRGMCPDLWLDTDRRELWERGLANRQAIHRRLARHRDAGRCCGLALTGGAPRSIRRHRGKPAFEVLSVRPAYRLGPARRTIADLVIEITQERDAWFDEAVQARADAGEAVAAKPDFTFRGGATLLVDLQTGVVRHSIGKGITSRSRMDQQRRYLWGRQQATSGNAAFAGPEAAENAAEPFARLHRSVGIGAAEDL